MLKVGLSNIKIYFSFSHFWVFDLFLFKFPLIVSDFSNLERNGMKFWQRNNLVAENEFPNYLKRAKDVQTKLVGMQLSLQKHFP